MVLRRLFINSNGLPGIASATMYEGAKDMSYCDTQLRVAAMASLFYFKTFRN